MWRYTSVKFSLGRSNSSQEHSLYALQLSFRFGVFGVDAYCVDIYGVDVWSGHENYLRCRPSELDARQL
jgi:hypothetical protein